MLLGTAHEGLDVRGPMLSEQSSKVAGSSVAAP